MPKYVLTYFNSKGRAEAARLIFAYAGQEYEDRRIERADWPALKPKMPFGELPVLEVDGKLLSQSVALTRYLARKFNLAGKDEWESAQCDALIDGWEDFFHLALPVMLESDAEKRKSLAEEFQKKHFEPFLERYEKFLVNNGGNYFVGNQVTWVDLQMYHYLQILQIYFPSVFESHKKILDFMKKIEEIPSIKKWVETRPKTEH